MESPDHPCSATNGKQRARARTVRCCLELRSATAAFTHVHAGSILLSSQHQLAQVVAALSSHAAGCHMAREPWLTNELGAFFASVPQLRQKWPFLHKRAALQAPAPPARMLHIASALQQCHESGSTCFGLCMLSFARMCRGWCPRRCRRWHGLPAACCAQACWRSPLCRTRKAAPSQAQVRAAACGQRRFLTFLVYSISTRFAQMQRTHHCCSVCCARVQRACTRTLHIRQAVHCVTLAIPP